MAAGIGKKTRNKSDKETFRFTLILAGRSEITDELEQKLSEAGCDDALLGTCDGELFLDFDRVADSLEHAIVAAIHEVEVKVGLGLRVAHVEPPEVIRAINSFLELRRSSKAIPMSVRNDVLESFRKLLQEASERK